MAYSKCTAKFIYYILYIYVLYIALFIGYYPADQPKSPSFPVRICHVSTSHVSLNVFAVLYATRGHHHSCVWQAVMYQLSNQTDSPSWIAIREKGLRFTTLIAHFLEQYIMETINNTLNLYRKVK